MNNTNIKLDLMKPKLTKPINKVQCLWLLLEGLMVCSPAVFSATASAVNGATTTSQPSAEAAVTDPNLTDSSLSTSSVGAAGLVCAYMLGPRAGYGKVPFIPYNLVYTLVGASLLWVGWFGFNARSAGAADGRAGMAMLVTQVATALAALSWIIIEWFAKARITMLGFASGAVAGLVAITPTSGFVNVSGPLMIGLAVGICCYLGATSLKRLLGADDALDVFGIHGVGGIVGAILTGVFANKAISGLDANVMVQTIAAFGTLIYNAVVTLIILVIVDKLIGLRVEGEQEHDGLDLTQHAERVM